MGFMWDRDAWRNNYIAKWLKKCEITNEMHSRVRPHSLEVGSIFGIWHDTHIIVHNDLIQTVKSKFILRRQSYLEYISLVDSSIGRRHQGLPTSQSYESCKLAEYLATSPAQIAPAEYFIRVCVKD